MPWTLFLLHTALFFVELADAMVRDNNGARKREYRVYCLWLRYALIAIIGVTAWSSTHAIIALLCAATLYNWIGTWLAAHLKTRIVNRSS